MPIRILVPREINIRLGFKYDPVDLFGFTDLVQVE